MFNTDVPNTTPPVNLFYQEAQGALIRSVSVSSNTLNQFFVNTDLSQITYPDQIATVINPQNYDQSTQTEQIDHEQLLLAQLQRSSNQINYNTEENLQDWFNRLKNESFVSSPRLFKAKKPEQSVNSNDVVQRYIEQGWSPVTLPHSNQTAQTNPNLAPTVSNNQSREIEFNNLNSEEIVWTNVDTNSTDTDTNIEKPTPDPVEMDWRRNSLRSTVLTIETYSHPNTEKNLEFNEILTQRENLEYEEIPPTTPNTIDENLLEPLEIEKPFEDNVEMPEMNWRRNGLESISSTVEKYPYIVDPTDNLTFEPQNFRPDRDENYSTLALRVAENNPVLNYFTFAHFPRDDQFYWLLDNNRIVIETQGSQGGIFFQGRSTTSEYTQSLLSQQRFLGLQAVWSLPQIPKELVSAVDNNQLSLLVVGGQVVTPEGTSAGEVTIDSGINSNDPNVTFFNVPNLGSASTNNPQGGGSLFQNLDAENAPKFIQAFPTNNLQPLLQNGVALRTGEIIPLENLEAAGIGFRDPATGEGFKFEPPLTSIPGIKVGQPGGGMSWGLINSVVNPFLSRRERDLAYLDSLWWIPIGQRTLANFTVQESQETDDWYRLYFSVPHKKTLIQYNGEEISVNYQSIFTNPGISLTASFDNDGDPIQFINSTLGLTMGGVFRAIENQEIENSLDEAKEALNNGEGFSFLDTTTTPEQRRQLNQRLNQNLFNTNRVTQLEQLSGNYTFPSNIYLDHSNLLQIRTGLYKRRVEFFGREIGDFQEVVTFFSDVDRNDFGPLGFIGVLYPTNETGLNRINESSALQVALMSPDGKTFIQEFSSQSNGNNPENTVIPIIAGKAFDIAFDTIRIAQLVERKITDNSFLGEIYLPSLEIVYSGTSDNFNYGISGGTWFNVNPNSVAVVDNNNLGLKEPNMGGYLHSIANFTIQNVQFNEENQPIGIHTHVPFLDVNWNTAPNRLNTFQIATGYTFSSQNRNLGYSATGALVYIPQGSNGVIPENSNGETLGVLNGKLGTQFGLGFATNLELGKEVFYNLELTQRVFDNFSLGFYHKNFNINNIGLDSRIDDTVYGGIIRYLTSDERIIINAELGNSGNGFDARLNSTVRFNF
jgi:hypothetical protein